MYGRALPVKIWSIFLVINVKYMSLIGDNGNPRSESSEGHVGRLVGER